MRAVWSMPQTFSAREVWPGMVKVYYLECESMSFNTLLGSRTTLEGLSLARARLVRTPRRWSIPLNARKKMWPTRTMRSRYFPGKPTDAIPPYHRLQEGILQLHIIPLIEGRPRGTSSTEARPARILATDAIYRNASPIQPYRISRLRSPMAQEA